MPMLPAASPFAKRGYLVMGLVAAVAAALDQLSKMAVMRQIPFNGTVPVIRGFFDLVNIRNRGAAFGFLNRADIDWQIWLFSAATLAALVILILLVRCWQKWAPVLYASLGLIMGGALGNWLDRIRYRAVVDFLDFYAGSWHWPAFNVADICICCGVFWACLILWREPAGGSRA